MQHVVYSYFWEIWREFCLQYIFRKKIRNLFSKFFSKTFFDFFFVFWKLFPKFFRKFFFDFFWNFFRNFGMRNAILLLHHQECDLLTSSLSQTLGQNDVLNQVRWLNTHVTSNSLLYRFSETRVLNVSNFVLHFCQSH